MLPLHLRSVCQCMLSIARRSTAIGLCWLALVAVAAGQQAVPLDDWVSAGLPEGAWIEPFDTLSVTAERVQSIPPVESEVTSRIRGLPVVQPVTFEVTATSTQPLAPPQPPPEQVSPEAVSPGAFADTAGPSAVAGDSGGQEQTFGERPVNNNLQFLRRDSVLIGAGKCQFDYGINYTLFENDIPVAQLDEFGDVVGVSEGMVRQRLLFSPFGYRYGFSDRLQFNAYLPVGWANSEFSVTGASTEQNRGGLGDLTVGISGLLWQGEAKYEPDAIATFGFTAPTGDFAAPLFGFVPGSALGQGFWAINANLLFVNRYDPIIAFYGVGYRHLFERSLGGSPFQPGEQFSYQFGVGFAVNDRVTLSSTLFGYYITNTEVNRQTIEGTNLEPISLRFAATVVRNHKIVEPFAAFGLTDAAPSAYLGVVWTLY